MSDEFDFVAHDLLPVEADGQQPLPFRLTGSQAKTAFALRLNAEKLVNGDGDGHFATAPNGKLFWKVERPEFLKSTGFLTLTVGDFICQFHGQQLPTDKGDDHRIVFCPCCGSRMAFVQVKDSEEANRRLNNLNRHVLPAIFSRAILVTERHKSGAVHFHLLGRLASGADIRTGLNFEAIEKRDYRSAPEALRALWAVLRDVLPRYGFGRAELLPVKKTSEAVAAYISKYIEKNICNRLKEDKGKKLVRYIGWNKRQLKPNEFSWATERARAWRGKAREMASYIGITQKEQCADALGPRWALHLTTTWQGRTRDEVVPFLVADWATKRLLANDLAQVSRRKRPGWLEAVERGMVPFLTARQATDILQGWETETVRNRFLHGVDVVEKVVELPETERELFRLDAGLPPEFDAELANFFEEGGAWESYCRYERDRGAFLKAAAAEREAKQLTLN